MAVQGPPGDYSEQLRRAMFAEWSAPQPPRYTTEDMLRDMMVPITIAILFAAVWLTISAIEARATNKPFWHCVVAACALES